MNKQDEKYLQLITSLKKIALIRGYRNPKKWVNEVLKSQGITRSNWIDKCDEKK